MAIVLIGPPAAGKSRIGRALARSLHQSHLDTDALIVERHGSISTIFADQGESAFRSIERAVVQEALGQDAVVSLGGGAVLDPGTQRALASATVILLTISRDAVAGRIDTDHRPLVSSLDDWQRLVDERSALYTSLADVSVDTSGRRPAAITAEIEAWLHSRGILEDA